jgi:aquaporin Z
MRLPNLSRLLLMRYLAALPALRKPPFVAWKHNWPLYICEASELALFMLSACAFSVFLFNPSWPASRIVPDPVVRRVLMSIAMGITAIAIIHSPMGKRSGAHFNPAITLTYFRLGKIGLWDAVFYVLFQFVGGVFGVATAAILLGRSLAIPAVDYAITVPGRSGQVPAFFAELFMALALMTVVLFLSNRVELASYVSVSVGILIALYTFFLAPISGVGINPARTTGSAFFAGVWTAGWLYFIAPLLGMFLAAEAYVQLKGVDCVLCAKLHPDSKLACPFNCRFPGHHRRVLRMHVETDHTVVNSQSRP